MAGSISSPQYRCISKMMLLWTLGLISTNKTKAILTLYEIISLFVVPITGHSRWKCPEPRSPSTGIKSGPCGDETNNFSNELGLEIKPGPLRLIFEESIHHTGAPFRISLSEDGSDDSSCVLLDHIPHNDCCIPSYLDESTYTPYVITVNIPNVICDKCSLHLSNPMTDKIGDGGSPSGIGCTDPGTCFSVYHSCTKPFRILGDVNNDAVLRSEYDCNSDAVNGDWPKSWMGDNGESVDASTPFLYRRESASWSSLDYTLHAVSSQYTKDAGGICGGSGELDSTENTPTEYIEQNEGVSEEVEKTHVGPDSSDKAENAPQLTSTSKLLTSKLYHFLFCQATVIVLIMMG